MDKLKNFFKKEEQKPTLQQQIANHLPSLSFKQKVIGFSICFSISLLIIIFSFVGIGFLFLSTGLFAVFYTLGNIMLLLSTGFVIGFLKQLKNMFDSKRIIATIIFIAAIIMIFISVFVIKSSLVAFIFVIIQFCAFTWYIFTYIPGGTYTIKAVCTSCCV